MFTPAELAAYLDEALPPEAMAAIETALRSDPKLIAQLTEIIANRDAGQHSLGDIWRRNRLSCPTREQLGSHLLGILSEEESAFVKFHIDVVGCRYCRANVDDLKTQQAAASDRSGADVATSRRQKYFQSSAGHLRGGKR